MNLVDTTMAALRRAAVRTGHDLLKEKQIIGFSGGPDSLALLHILRQLLPAQQLVVAHLDHALRPTSAGESKIVARMASGLNFRMERVDVANLAAAKGITIEEAGRMARYSFLARIARQEGAESIVVGHNADDQAETILMHILRGSGLAGLRGMQPASPLPGLEGLWLLRPLLDATRAEIEAYCLEQGLEPIIDASNMDQSFFRNRLRHDLLPALESYSPQVRQRLLEMADIVAADEQLLSFLTEGTWHEVLTSQTAGQVMFRLTAWRTLDLSLRRRLLRRAIAEIRPGLSDVSFRTLESARRVAETGKTGSKASISGGLMLQVSYDQLIIGNGPVEDSIESPRLPSLDPVPLPIPGSVDLLDGWRITAEWAASADTASIRVNPDPWTAFAALDSLDALTVRARTPGERIHPLGLGGQTKVKEIMIDRKIPAGTRDRWPLIAIPQHAVWIAGHVLDDRVKVRADSKRIVRLWCGRVVKAEVG